MLGYYKWIKKIFDNFVIHISIKFYVPMFICLRIMRERRQKVKHLFIA